MLLAALAALAGVLAAVLSGGGPPPLPLPGIGKPARSGDPFAYIPSRADDFVARATAGEAHVLFVKSPGGALATAARVAALRPLIDRAAAGSGIDPGTLEGIVFLESAGDPYAIAGSDPANAAGLTQIVASTGVALLGMHINLAASRSLTSRINRAATLGETGLLARLLRERARVDSRFDPRHALAATVRYLKIAEHDFGRLDLAVASYHMGIGNLMSVLQAYDGGQPVPYVQLFFDTAPDRHPGAFRILSGFGDDSWTYLWRVLAAEQIMRLYRTDPTALRRFAALQTAAGSAAYALHPPDRLVTFASPDALDAAYGLRQILPLPANARSLGLAYDPQMGALAPRLGFRRALYRGLRAPALDLLIELGVRVRRLWGGRAPLVVTSTVLDRAYQRRLGIDDPAAAAGWSFTIARRYAAEGQALAFQAMLDRLQALNLIAWQRYPAVIEVTVASDAARAIVNGP
ncbi:MAG TPA: transglycosylase SLT domain-containing protein [Solirubrobacteraceae bacterium]|nr:transglycosylase SLT domain-containing protein [Solirubrobacteraceae bacterium]